jgi:NADH-quinone oxidoreductase subunit G
MELGMAGRGEHSEIMSFVGRSVDSELSGNMIDVCPVGALTSKPFRYSARTWELARRRSVAPHDSLGSNIVVQVKGDRVMRVVPLDNEAVNECWISDRDRFSYEGLNSQERLTEPMIRQNGEWQTVSWQTALEYAAHALTRVRDEQGGQAIGALGSAHSTVEESYLLGQLIRGLGSGNIDFRLRQVDSSADPMRAGVPWLGMSIEALGQSDRMLIVGSFLRKDHPLLAARIRAAVRRGARVAMLHAAAEDLLMPVAVRSTVAPSGWTAELAGIVVAMARAKSVSVPSWLSAIEPSPQAVQTADLLASGQSVSILLGNAVAQHPEQAALLRLAQAVAELCGGRLGVLMEAANSVGSWLAGAVPSAGALDARSMIEQPRALYLLLNNEPSLDHALPALSRAALASAQSVIALSAFRSPELLELADCLLPITPFTETAGSFVNCEGRLQAFNGVVRPAGQARPGWKVLRVLADMTGVAGAQFDSAEAVRAAALPSGWESRLNNAVSGEASVPAANDGMPLERLADVPIYFADPLVRRAESLQQTRDARQPRARLNLKTLQALGLSAGSRVRVEQSMGGATGSALLELELDDTLADRVVRIAAAHPSTAGLLSLGGAVTVTGAA